MNTQKLASVCAALLGLAFFPVSATAQTVNMTFNNVYPLINVSGNAGTGTFSAGDGLLGFQVLSVTPAPLIPFPATLALFCIELQQQITNNQNANYTLLSADQAAKGVASGLSANIGIGGIGAARARNLEILYAQVFGTNYDPANTMTTPTGSLTIAQKQQAFQFAVWELSHDDDFNLVTVSITPRLWITSPGNPIRGEAQLLVDAVFTATGDINAARMSLSVLHNAGVQDFLIPDALITPIPEPSVYAAMVAILTFGVVAARRHRSQAAG